MKTLTYVLELLFNTHVSVSYKYVMSPFTSYCPCDLFVFSQLNSVNNAFIKQTQEKQSNLHVIFFVPHVEPGYLYYFHVFAAIVLQPPLYPPIDVDVTITSWRHYTNYHVVCDSNAKSLYRIYSGVKCVVLECVKEAVDLLIYTLKYMCINTKHHNSLLKWFVLVVFSILCNCWP